MTGRAATVHPGDVWEDSEDGERARARVIEGNCQMASVDVRGPLHQVRIASEAPDGLRCGTCVRQRIWHPRWVLVERAGVAVKVDR